MSTNTSQHESTRINTSQHESTRVLHESTRARHESTRINTSQTRVNMSPTRINTNQHESARVSQTMKLAQFIVVQSVNYDNSLIGLNIMFSHQLELESKENQEQIGRNLDAVKVFIDNFSFQESNINLFVRSKNHTPPIFYNSLAFLYPQVSHDNSKHFTSKL